MHRLRSHQGSDAGSVVNLASGVSAVIPASADVLSPSAPVHGSISNNNSNNNSKRSSNSARSNTKATVHINGITVDHFQQNSDVDEDRASMIAGSEAACRNSDVQGFISYSSDSSMIELNLKFKKCACNENIINISKENLQQQQRKDQRNPEPLLGIGSNPAETETTTAASTTFSKEGNRKKLLQLNKDNLNSLVTQLNDTNSSSSSCTKCRLSLDIKNILNQIVSDRKLKYGTQLQTDQDKQRVVNRAPVQPEPGVRAECNRTLQVVDKFGGSPSKAASWSPLLPSPLSVSPSPSVADDDINRLQRRHSETVERRSIGVQHGLRSGYRKRPQLRKGKTQVEEIIVISDEFRRQSLSDQKVRIHRARKISKSMESIDQQVNETSKALGAIECLHLEDDTLTVVVDSDATLGNGHQKSKSKSVDDISLSSNHNEDEFAPLTRSYNAANSVELVFISDEFVQRKSKQDVIIVDANPNVLRRKKSTSKNAIVISDEHKQKSTAAKSKMVKSASLKSKDPRRKTTISNSNSFLTYEEPFSPDTLENKDIGTMFAEATATAESKSDLNSSNCRPK
ncbi:uncharacterized protein LOC131686904 [Topomyia yanbarensis]|uniref:uncharacterized protein LOC131686904 n=1 Tax=Topomyia yanbarensis TaxID=2498891 RepID=UPI00273BC667|nr:uncharacterized protein LOC131686904 [Topomyia yanbarensis]